MQTQNLSSLQESLYVFQGFSQVYTERNNQNLTRSKQRNMLEKVTPSYTVSSRPTADKNTVYYYIKLYVKMNQNKHIHKQNKSGCYCNKIGIR